ncbi:dTMP kinase [Peptoniphilus equinus]|uniref:Thymidylate kinase n=1 Tax=Peptoniphilus equinus TaxID=3016343 RepID=A0ABY7QSJ5_9FIRM|nr:dTMP kinase [Peptoniphilus equinus]WBW49760.1 dTMP kinase [Peptoniphilus equinus]
MQLFIAFEGPDGCGKTTIASRITETLQADYDVVRTREPGGTAISETIRNLILDNHNVAMTARTEALLYAAARAQHTEELIRPALDAGKIVITERYVISSYVYQGFARGLGVEAVKAINAFATAQLRPDITFIFDTKAQRSVERKLMLGADRMENAGASFHDSVAQAYRHFYDDDGVVVIDATQSIDEVYAACMREIETRLS